MRHIFMFGVIGIIAQLLGQYGLMEREGMILFSAASMGAMFAISSLLGRIDRLESRIADLQRN